jgi:hypothetical protein
VVSGARPPFAWEDLGGGTQYTFLLRGAEGKELFRTATRVPRADLPPDLQLQEEITYTWSVAATLLDGTIRKAQAELELLDRDVRKRLAALKVHRGDSFSMGVTYAAALQEAGLQEEASAEWRALLAQRPGDLVLAAYAK